MSQLTFAQVVKNKPTPPPLSPPLSPLSLNNPELYKDNNANTWFYRQVDRKNVKLPPVKTTIKPLANVFSRSLIIIFSETFEMFRFIIFDEIESALDSGNRVSVLKKLYAYLNVRNIATIWITHMCQCELSKCGIDFDGGRLILCPIEDGTGARIQHNKQN